MSKQIERRWRYDWRFGIMYGSLPVGLIVVVAVALAFFGYWTTGR